MGKKNKGKYNKLGYFGKKAADDRMAEKYGINKGNFSNELGGVKGNYGNFNEEGYRQAISRAASNDYDMRRSIEAAQASGNKKAQALGQGISNMSEVMAAERFMEKTHKKRMGNTGNYGSANDEGNVTSYWVDKDRNKLTAGMSADEQQQTAQKPDEPYTPSQELTDARNTVEEYDNKDFNVYNNSSATNAYEAGDNDGQRKQAAQSFFDKYKLDVKSSANFKPNL